ncbi:MAG: DUF2799 domain-containing protein [Woeseiaceae bacterium]|nr:DUF2799 domain-containing protein [Woeseiaceae bacterium]NIP20075.1 DUF2799 domain-containing protein [Woeseiaceae bacterium]NIS88871.1 DUF2799 domain-containing protein [Woeseiaceae bacterium]
MNSKSSNILVALAAVVLGGCASMSADECLTVDWTSIGYEDGSRGYTADRLGAHRKACAKHGVTPDFAAYQRGHAQGVEAFCQPGRAFSFGENGGRYNGICPADMEPEFLEAYNAGHKLYSLRSSLSAANSMIYSKEQEMEYAQKRIVEAEVALISDEATAEERILLLNELKDLAERMGELEAEIEQLIADRARIEQELQYYESTITAYRY